MTYNSQTIAFGVFCSNMLFSYFLHSYNMVSSLEVSNSQFLMVTMSKWLISSKVLQLHNFSQIFCSSAFCEL